MTEIVAEILYKISKTGTINPYSIEKFLFDVLTFFVILTNIIYLPIRHSFNDNYEIFKERKIEKITLFFLAAEICVNLSTQFYHRGLLVKDRLRVTKRYLQGRIWIDIIVAIPYLLSELNPQLQPLNLFYLIRFLDFITIFNKIEDKILRKDHIGDALKCILLIFFVAHLSACSIHYISLIPRRQSEKSYLDTMDVDMNQWFQVYAYSFYWSIITMTTIGYGDIHPNSHRERLYATFFALLSCVVFGFTLNQIGSIISHIYMSSAQIRRKQAIIDSYMKQRQVSQDLQIKVKKNLEYIHNDTGQQDKVVDEIINSLASSLRNELKADLYKNILFKNVESFHFNFSDPFLYELSMLFQEQTFNQEQFIYNEKEPSNKFYFIIRGDVELYYKKNKCPITIKKNEILGLEEFFSQQARQMSAKTSRATTVAFISYEDFFETLKKHQLDQETYKMIFDSMNLNGYTSRIQIKCYNCNSLSHKFMECPYLFFQKDEKLFRENMVIKGEIYKICGGPASECVKRVQGKKYNCIAKKNQIWGQLFNYLCDNLQYIECYYSEQVMQIKDQNLDSQEDDEENEDGEEGEEEEEEGEEDQMDQDLQGNMQNTKGQQYLTAEEESQSPYVAIRMLKSQNREHSGNDLNIKRQRMALDLNNPMTQYFFAGKNRSNSNINIEIQQAQNQFGTTTETQDNQESATPVITVDSNNLTPTLKVNVGQEFDRQINQLEQQIQTTNPQDQQNNGNQLAIFNLLNKDNLSFSFNQKDEQSNALQTLPQNKLSKNQSSKSPSENSNLTMMNVHQFPANTSIPQNLLLHFKSDSKQTSGNFNSPQFVADPLQNRQNEKFKFEIDNSCDNIKSEQSNNIKSEQSNNIKSEQSNNIKSDQSNNTPQQTPFSDHQSRKASYFSGYQNRKQSDMKKDELTIHLMPLNNQQSHNIDESAPSPALYQLPNTWNQSSNIENRHKSLSGLNNEYIFSSGQDNNPQVSQLQLEPISPIKQNTKNENTSPMVSLNNFNKELFSHSDLQFDIQSDNYSPKQKILAYNNLEVKKSPGSSGNKQIQNQTTFTSQVEQDHQSNQRKFIKQLYSQTSSTISQNLAEDRLNAQNIIGNKARIPSSENNSVSIKLDENQEYQQTLPNDTRNLSLRENTISRGQPIRKSSQKNNTLVLQFGQQMQIFNSDLDNPSSYGAINQIPPINFNQNTQGTIVSARNDENYNTSQSYLYQPIYENTQDYHPSFKDRKLSYKKQQDLFNEKINALQNSAQKERMKSFIQSRNSQKVIRSQKNIDSGSQIIRKNHKKQISSKISSTYAQQIDLLSQSQDIPNNLDALPNLKKFQSARIKSPQIIPYDQNAQISKQLDLYQQQINNNKRPLDQNFDKAHQQNHSLPNQTVPTLLHAQSNSTHNTKHSRSNHEHDQQGQTHDSRIQKHLNKQQTQKLQFKLPDDNVNTPTHYHQHKSLLRFSMNSNSLNNSLNQIGQQEQKFVDREGSEDSQQERFNILSDFDSLKSYKVYFPWNNYQKILKNLLNTKKKKKQDLISLFTTQKVKTRICRQNNCNEKDQCFKKFDKSLPPSVSTPKQ